MPTGDGAALVDDLLDAALLRGSFTLRSGAVSDRYFDKFRASCNPHLLRRIAAAFDAMCDEHAPDATCIVAPELGAVPLATALALTRDLPLHIVRGAAKSHGTSVRVEGPVLSRGARAVLLEDVVTSGSAALDALEVAQRCGLVVKDALCVLDRDGGGRDALAARGVTLHALCSARDVQAAIDAGRGQLVTIT